MKTRLTPFRTRWMRSVASILAAAIGLMLLAACASSAPASAPAATTHPDSAQAAPEQQDYASAASDRLIELGVISPGSIEKAVDGDELIVEVPVGSPNGLATGSLLVIDMSAHPNPDQLQPEDILTLSVAGALADSLVGLPDDLSDQVSAQIAPDESALVVSRSKGRAEVRGPDGQLISDADESTGQNWRPGEALQEAVAELAGGEKWLWDAGTNSWQPGESAVGGATAEPATAQPPTANPTEKLPTATPTEKSATPTPVPATPTSPPAPPTEVPTQEPTPAEQSESPEHIEAMENARKWVSGELQVPDELRFRDFVGELEEYGRLQKVEVDRSVEPIELYTGVVLGVEKLPNGDVIVYLGFEDSQSKRFIAPLRVGNNSTAMDIPVVNSAHNSSAGDDADTHGFFPPEEVGQILAGRIGQQVIVSTVMSSALVTDEMLQGVPPFYWQELQYQFPSALNFDRAMFGMANGLPFDNLPTEQKTFFDLEIDGETLPMTTQLRLLSNA